MRSPRWILVVAVAIALLAVPFLPAARADTSKPTWTAGDWWSYGVSGTGSETSTLPPLGNGTVRYDVVSTDSIQVGGATITAYHTKVNYTIHHVYGSYNFTISLTGDEWFRESDLAPAKLGLTATVLTFTLGFNASFNPPLTIQWPLTSGSSWGVTTSVSFAINLFGVSNQTTASESFSDTVGPDTSVQVAAGTFTATPVNVSATGGYSITYWSSTAGNSVSQKNYAPNGTQTGKMELQAYNYQGGGVLNTLILGIPLLYWLILLVVVVVVVAALVVVRGRKRRVQTPPPPAQPPVTPPPGSPP